MTLATLPQTHANPDRRKRRGYASGKADYQARLAMIEGQIRGPQRMVADVCYAPDVVVQIVSATGALQESPSGYSMTIASSA